MPAPGRCANALLVAMRAYRSIHAGRPSPCRFEPSCSAYALTAVSDHGAAKGAWLVARRLGRCHPFGGHGWDPVPPAPPDDRYAPLPFVSQGET